MDAKQEELEMEMENPAHSYSGIYEILKRIEPN